MTQGTGELPVFSCDGYIASDMEEDNPTSKRSIFQFLLGKEHWPDLYKEFLQLKMEFFHAMGYRAWVTPELCKQVCGGCQSVGWRGGVGDESRSGPPSSAHSPAFPFQIQAQNPHHWVWSQGAPVHPIGSQGKGTTRGSWMGLQMV
ncbi:hypothetical protein P7K49_029372 [Saguinus oedipus]|uniref:Uncharacterized protein n=1 Tax=Saguinus oedipus TaxID=9490 RepID=A0ABQ9U896_SAGOE|nr:hypothetical protein P7K49_029372 [Saguinus oedipus]